MRVLLKVPATALATAFSALDSGAAGIIIDLGSLAPEHKAGARAALRDAMLGRASDAPSVIVRVASLRSGSVTEDLDAIMPARPDAILLSDCRDGADIQHLGAILAVREAENALVDGSTRILAAVCEAPGGLFGLGALAGASQRLDALVWDAAVLARALGVPLYTATTGEHAGPVGLARAMVIHAAAAAGVIAYETVLPDADSPDTLATSVRCARRDGFSGVIAAEPQQCGAIARILARPAKD